MLYCFKPETAHSIDREKMLVLFTGVPGVVFLFHGGENVHAPWIPNQRQFLYKGLEHQVVDEKCDTVIDGSPHHFGSESVEKGANASLLVQFASYLPRTDPLSTLGILYERLHTNHSSNNNMCKSAYCATAMLTSVSN